jgi:hypothetical protein
MIKFGIAGLSGNQAHVSPEGHWCADAPGLVVATRPLKDFSNQINFFVNSTYGSEMAQDASFGGNPDEIHDGIDNVYWTASAISGTWDFNSAAQNHTGGGANSIDATATVNGDEALFTRAASIALSGYVSLTGWVYLTGWGVGTKHVETRSRLAGSDVGTTVNIDDYIDTDTIGSWQKFSIPKADMGVASESVDELVVKTVKSSGLNPDYYLDDLQWEETGTPLTYEIVPDDGTWLHIDKLMITYADAYTGIVTVAGNTENAMSPNIPYNGWFGVSALSSGLVYQRWQNGEIVNAFPIKQHLDLMNFSEAQVSGYGSDGTNSWCSVLIKFTAGVVLKPEKLDKLDIQISEDLSGLLSLKVSAGGKVEVRK